MTTIDPNQSGGMESPSEDLLQRIAHLTRMLRESMRELGLDQAIKEAAEAIPDARDRLGYVARMTEQAANRVLNAVEEVQPLQENILNSAQELEQRWAQWTPESDAAQTASLVHDTRHYLQESTQNVKRSQENLLDIMMAQDFQDLTGQVIMRMLGVIGAIETELLQVLIDNVPKERRDDPDALVNGPQLKTDNRPDIVTSQDQVDDLLADLGF
ncbi:MAG TPA: protein phosphatase CheZ [Burkholderiaceae bacterium]|nr:protein phosphatase CheZ [Burkholderiaceae bacterium]